MARIQRTNGKICRRNGKLEPCGGCVTQCGCRGTAASCWKITLAGFDLMPMVFPQPGPGGVCDGTPVLVSPSVTSIDGEYQPTIADACQAEWLFLDCAYVTGDTSRRDWYVAGDLFLSPQVDGSVKLTVEIRVYPYGGNPSALTNGVGIFYREITIAAGECFTERELTNDVYDANPIDSNPSTGFIQCPSLPTPWIEDATVTITPVSDGSCPLSHPIEDPGFSPCGSSVCVSEFSYQWNCETSEVVQDVTLVGTTCRSYPGSDHLGWEVTDISWPITTLRKYVVTGPCTTGGDCYDADYPEAPDVISLGGCGTCPPNAPIIEAGLSEEGNLIGFLDAGDYIAEYIDGAWLPGPEGVYSYSTEVAVANSDANVVYDHIGEPYYTGPGILDYEAAESLAAGKRYKFTVYADANYFLRCRDDPGFYGDDTAGDPYNARYRICPMNPLP